MILVLGGTSDSIGICNKLNEMNLPYMVSVTTEYGRDIAKKATENVFLGKLTIEDMVSLIKEKNITQIIDATHPYATIVSSNAIECSKISNTDYVRFERESLIKQIDYDDIYVVEDIEQVLKELSDDEVKLINSLYLGEKPLTESAYADYLGVSQQAINKKKLIVLGKLKKIF